MSITLDDVRYALRSMRGNPGFTLVAVVSLALGIGVNTAIFALVDQFLLWTIPARESARLVNIEGGRSSAYPFYCEYRDRNHVFAGVIASSQLVPSGIWPEGASAVGVGKVAYVSGNYFPILGTGAATGRVLSDSDDRKPGGAQVAVLSYRYWQRRFNSRRDVIGRKVKINGYPLEVVGIAEKGFDGIVNRERPDVFLPLTAYPLTTPAAASMWNSHRMHWLTTMARLRPGVSIESAQADMRVIWAQAADAFNQELRKAGKKPRSYTKEDQIRITPGAHGASSGAMETVSPLVALMVATGLVLLIACANVANLLLARAAQRRQEIAVRMALGASRARLIRQTLTESLVLALMGGVAGIAVAYGGVQAIAAAKLGDAALSLRPSVPLAVFSAALTLVTGIVFGLVPALRITGFDLAAAAQGSGKTSPSGSRVRFGKVLIAGQAALSLALLAGAGLFIRTLYNLEKVDLGYQRENVMIFDVDANQHGYKEHRLRTFYDQLLERTRRVPGVRSAGLAGMTPMGSYAMTRSFSAEGYQPRQGERMVAYSSPVTDGYFTTLGIPMLLGRDFRPEDEPAVTPRDSLFGALGRMSGGGAETAAALPRVCIINESLARRLFGTANPVGRRISLDDTYDAQSAIEIAGVVKDVRHGGVRQADDIGTIYTPSWSKGAASRYLVVRTSGSTKPLAAAIQRELRDMDPGVPLLAGVKLSDSVSTALRDERMIAYLCACFGGLALVLAAVGLYGVMAYAVVQRTREIGIRVALGALRSDVAAMILREALVPVLAGIAIGIAAALAATRLATSLLFGVASNDPLSFAFAAAVMLAVALLTVLIPAWRASRVEPVVSLRHE